jgi:hypothetical protein
MLMETSADEDMSIKLQDRITAYGRKFEALKKALDAPGGSLHPHERAPAYWHRGR